MNKHSAWRETRLRKGIENYPDDKNHEIVVWEDSEPIRGYIGDAEIDYVRDWDSNPDCC